MLSSLEGLGSCTALRALRLSRCDGISDFQPLSSLCGLVEICVHGCGISDLRPLTSLCSLTSLNLNECTYLPRGALTSLCTFTALSQLDIRNCGDLDIAPLASCTNLRILCLSTVDISLLSPLTQLQIKVNTSCDWPPT
jgi:Leucine-rich repeat (LRR) protein